MSVFAIQKYQFKHFNVKLLLYVIAVTVVGILVIRSATMNEDLSTYYKQIMGVGAGFVLMFILAFVDYEFIMNHVIVVYVGTVLLGLLTKVIGTSAGTGAKRWLDIGPMRIQPSEFIKLGLILSMAYLLDRLHDQLSTLRSLAIVLAAFAIPLLFVMIQPDLSTSIVMMFIFLAMLYVAEISYKWVLGALGVGIPSLALFVFLIQHGFTFFLQPYQVNRILTFLPGNHSSDLTLQQDNSVVAIGSGQLYGKGLFNTSLESVKNGNFLMEQDTDFIFAVVGEELGFVGSCVVIILLALIVVECVLTAMRAKDLYGRLICVGAAAQIAFQSFVNIGVATKLLPNTGLPLPFISAGLSSLLSMFLLMGFVFNVGMQRKTEVVS